MTDEQLLGEVEDLLRSMPSPLQAVREPTPENHAWLGRVAAVLNVWKPREPFLWTLMDDVQSMDDYRSVPAVNHLPRWLYHARSDLRLKIPGRTSVAIGRGMIFDYFDEIRKYIELARNDLLFVDPYLDAEFVSRFLLLVREGVTVRLLAREKLQTLLPAVDALSQQSKLVIQIRSTKGFHDRYLFVDGSTCYQSGASFKDGGKAAGTTVTQIVDAFSAVRKTYEDLWTGSKVER